jgi:hypothetical protein
LSDRISFYALGNNLLRKPEDFFSLADYGTGHNIRNEKLQNSDLIFEYDIDP